MAKGIIKIYLNIVEQCKNNDTKYETRNTSANRWAQSFKTSTVEQIAIMLYKLMEAIKQKTFPNSMC